MRSEWGEKFGGRDSAHCVVYTGGQHNLHRLTSHHGLPGSLAFYIIPAAYENGFPH